MAIGGILKAVWEYIKKLLGLKGLSSADQLLVMIAFVPALVSKIQEIIKSKNIAIPDRKAAIDFILNEFDKGTGEEPGALDIIKTMPPGVEEKLFDHFIEVVRILSYHYCGVPGYLVEMPIETAAGIGIKPDSTIDIGPILSWINQMKFDQGQPGIQAAQGAAGETGQGTDAGPAASLIEYREKIGKQSLNPTAYMLTDQIETLRQAVTALLQLEINRTA